MPRLTPKTNPKCPQCGYISIKNGTRKIKVRSYQRFLCKSCSCHFSEQSSPQTSKTYPLKTILDSISSYNLGQPLRKQPIPKSTIHNWTKNINLPMNRLRNKLKGIPLYEIIKKQRFIHHKQPFLFQYHNLKLDFAKKFPSLINYIRNVHNHADKRYCNCSSRDPCILNQRRITN